VSEPYIYMSSAVNRLVLRESNERRWVHETTKSEPNKDFKCL